MFKLLANRSGFEDRIVGSSELEAPVERKNSILGKRVFLISHKSNCGYLWNWRCGYLWNHSLSAFFRLSKFTLLDAKIADCEDNQKEFMRYETIKECLFWLLRLRQWWWRTLRLSKMVKIWVKWFSIWLNRIK